MTLFEKIISREIPAEIVYEDELCLAFRDIHPQAPVHILLIPKKPIVSLDTCKSGDKELLGHLMICASQIARQEKLNTGYRVVTNISDEGGQIVPHLHFHIRGGRQMKWPPG